MLSGWHSSGASVRGTAATDTEALQTDVMRFIAIIGLCLTAIFSLMRSISEPVDNSADQAENENLRQQLDSLQEIIAREQHSIQALEAELGTSQVRLALAERQAHELQQLRSQLSGLAQALKNRHQDQLQLQQKLAEYSAQAQELKRQLRNLQQEAVSAAEAQPPAPPPPTNTAYSAPVPGDPEPAPAADEASFAAAPEPVPGAPVEKGLVLRFASERALGELIDKGQVRLLALAGRQAWQLRLHRQDLVFQKTPLPDKYHEMLPETLPYRYQHAYYGSTNQARDPGAVWAVQLPLNIEHEIQRRLQTTSAGELIIQGDGSVSLRSGDNR